MIERRDEVDQRLSFEQRLQRAQLRRRVKRQDDRQNEIARHAAKPGCNSGKPFATVFAAMDGRNAKAAAAPRLQKPPGHLGPIRQREDRKGPSLDSSHYCASRMPSSALKKK